MTPKQHAILAMNTTLNFDLELKSLIDLRRRLLEACEKGLELAVQEARVEAIEEAAKAVEGFDWEKDPLAGKWSSLSSEGYEHTASEILAKKIRSLKEKV